MFKYALNRVLLIALVLTVSECVPKHKSDKSPRVSVMPRNQQPKELQIVFNLNKNDYSYTFSFLNLSKDTFSIQDPQTSYSGILGGYFQLFDEKLYCINTRCTKAKRDLSLKWISLEPGNKKVIKSSRNLEQFFCHVQHTFYLGFSYCSLIKRNDGTIKGMFNFDIQPTMIGLLDSSSVRKFIF